MVKEKMKNKTLKTILIVFFLTLLFVGLVLICIPYVERIKRDAEITDTLDEWKDNNSSQEEFPPDISESSERSNVSLYPELWEDMETYNKNIFLGGQIGLVDAWSYESEIFDLEKYGLPDDVVGYVSIPAIDVEMPLYLGANEENLAKGFAQLSQTSMPIGGKNTNCVLACHRGYNGSAFLRDADQIQEGDLVTVKNFWDTLTYQVYDTKIIEPHLISEILIKPGKDLLTIITCTPYGVGSHRLLILCERVNSVQDNTKPSHTS